MACAFQRLSSVRNTRLPAEWRRTAQSFDRYTGFFIVTAVLYLPLLLALPLCLRDCCCLRDAEASGTLAVAQSVAHALQMRMAHEVLFLFRCWCVSQCTTSLHSALSTAWLRVRPPCRFCLSRPPGAVGQNAAVASQHVHTSTQAGRRAGGQRTHGRQASRLAGKQAGLRMQASRQAGLSYLA